MTKHSVLSGMKKGECALQTEKEDNLIERVYSHINKSKNATETEALVEIELQRERK